MLLGLIRYKESETRGWESVEKKIGLVLTEMFQKISTNKDIEAGHKDIEPWQKDEYCDIHQEGTIGKKNTSPG